MGGEELTLRIQRFDPSLEERPHLERYAVPLKGGMTVLDALIYAKDRLDHGIAIAQVDLEDPLHPREHQHDASPHGQTAAGQARAGSAGYEGQVVFGGQAHYPGYVGRGAGKNHHVGAVFLDHEAVALEDHPVAVGGQHVLGAQGVAQAVDH